MHPAGGLICPLGLLTGVCTTCTGASRFGQSGASPPAQSQGTASPPSQSQAAASPPGGAFNNAAARSAVASPPSQAQGVASPPAQQQGVASPPAQQQVRTALDVHCCCARSECILPSNLACCLELQQLSSFNVACKAASFGRSNAAADMLLVLPRNGTIPTECLMVTAPQSCTGSEACCCRTSHSGGCQPP